VDLYLIHHPNLPRYPELWKEMVFVQKQGLAKSVLFPYLHETKGLTDRRSIGVSNFMIGQLEEVIEYTKVVPAVNQIQLHLYNYEDMKDLLAYHAAHGIVTEAYGSLAYVSVPFVERRNF
jgi:diketogulonate reductase-like aldo/keto reductase